MKRSFYGKKMLVTDLMLVSLWGLFFSNWSTAGMWLLIAVRVALSFEMSRKSPWTLVSAIGFLIGFSSSECVSRPIEGMFYYFFCAIGESDLMVSIFSEPLEWEMKVWLGVLTTLWYIWLAGLPLVQGILLRNLNEIKWKRKWIWIYLVPLTCLCVYVMLNEGQVGGFLWGFVIAFLPVVYWSIYDREGRSLVQLLLDDRRVMWYLGYAVFMYAVFSIGMLDITNFKITGLILLLPLFYIMLTRSLRLGTVMTRCCVALSLAGYLYWLTFVAEQWVALGLLATAIGLIAYVGVAIAKKTNRRGVSLVLVSVVPLVLIPGILGLNPYVCIDTDRTQLFRGGLYARNGVYRVEKTIKDPAPYEASTKYGLRDRYGMIIPPEYTDLLSLDYRGRYVVVNRPVGKGCLIKDQRLGVFDLQKRKFLVDLNEINVAEIRKIDDKTYHLIDPEGAHFAILYMRGEYNGEYYHDAHVEPVADE